MPVDSDRFFKLADSAPTPEQKEMFLQRAWRMKLQEKVDRCISCDLCQISRKIGYQGKSPSFTALVTELPEVDNRVLHFIQTRLLPVIGYKEIGIISMLSCDPDPSKWQRSGKWELEARYNPCSENFRMQMNLSSARVFVLMGEQAAGVVYGHGLVPSMKDIRGQWISGRNGSGQQQWFFVTDDPGRCIGNNILENLMIEDFQKLGTLLHYAWSVHMSELYPGAEFKHSMTYEEVCDVVANDIKQALRNIPPDKRSDEFMSIMYRIYRDGGGWAARAFWDNDMVKRMGFDPTQREWWIPGQNGDDYNG